MKFEVYCDEANPDVLTSANPHARHLMIGSLWLLEELRNEIKSRVGAGRLQTSTLRRRINQRDWHGAGQELRRWVYGGGKVLPGLVTRREAEVALLL